MRATRRVRRDARRLFALCLANGRLDEERARQVVRRIAAARFRNRAAVLAQLRRLVMLEQARHAARVESAAPLPPEMRAAVQARLERRYGPVAASFEEAPALLGGMRIRIADDVYDGSVRGALNAIEARWAGDNASTAAASN